MTWFTKRDLVVTMPDGTRRWALAGQPIPADMVDHVPARDRKRA